MPERAPRVILAFDFGLRRIGIKHYEPDLLLVGRPYNVDGSIGTLEVAAAQFAAAVAARSGRPVERVDERYSSLEASAQLRQARAAGTHGRIQRADIDGLAAAILLERYLRGEREKPG